MHTSIKINSFEKLSKWNIQVLENLGFELIRIDVGVFFLFEVEQNQPESKKLQKLISKVIDM